MTVNMPFSKLAVVGGDPIFVAVDADDAAMEKARLAVENSLNAVTARAYALAKQSDQQASDAPLAL
jgi:3-deoxy-D-manno-octulosonic-acid transferase